VDLHLDPKLSFGMCAGSLKPPQVSGVFFAKATLKLEQGAVASWAEEPEAVSGDVYQDDDPTQPLRYSSDFAVFKPRADLSLVGRAFAPDGQPTAGFRVRFAVGSYSKSLDVAGERNWRSSLSAAAGFTPPELFTTMPLGYDRAYGGPGFERNPVGKGRRGDAAHNLSDPERPFDTREPAGFGPLPPAWPQRYDLVGSYRGNYMKERWPWFPEDFDWGFFNAAPRDQQLDAYLRGDEPVVLESLNEQHDVLRSRLPGVRVRCFLEDRTPTDELRFREVPMRLDTLWIDTDSAKLILVWRGNADVRTPKMREIEKILVVAEPLTEAARPAAEYQAALNKPADAEVPPPVPLAPEQEELQKAMAQLDQNMVAIDKRAEAFDQEIAALEAQVDRDVGLAYASLPQGATVPPPDAPAPEQSMAEFVAEFAAGLERCRQTYPDQAHLLADIDPNELTQFGEEMTAMRAEMAQMKEGMAAAEARRWSRERLLEAAAADQSLTELDLAGLDLSGVDLSGRDLSRSRLKDANLQAANLAGAKLVWSDLSGANLEEADLTGAKLDGADLTDAVVKGAKLTGLSLVQTMLEKLDLAGADLSGCSGKEAQFAGANLVGAQLPGVRMPAADFSGCNLAKTNFAGAELRTARFEGAQAKEVDFTGAKLTGLHADEKADFTGGKFKYVEAEKAVFDTSKLDGADFSRAKLAGAQFEGSSLRAANLDRADLSGAMFDDADLRQAVLTNANLLRASLEGADLAGAVVEGSNFYEAGFWRAATDGVDFRNANRKRTLLG
jgi:uncharacterized protein YjbI with pentapeptide repeats